MSRSTFHGLALVAGFAALVAANEVRAQDASPDVAARAELLHRAQDASTHNNHAEALDLAERAARISMTTSLRAFIAYEQEQLGQIVEGLSNAEQCTREVNNNPTLPQRSSIQLTCRQIIQRLEPRVGHITVHVTNPPDGTRIMVGGHELNNALYGIPYIVTPGTVPIEADAPGRAHFQTTVEVQPAGSQDVTVTLLELERRTQPTATTTTTTTQTHHDEASAAPPASATPAAAGQTDHASSGVPIVPIVVGAVGAIAFAVGGVMWVQFESERNKGLQNGGTPGDTNLTRANDLSASDTFRDVAIGCFIGGGVAVVAAVVVGVLGRGHGHAGATSFLAPVPGGAVVGIGGAL